MPIRTGAEKPATEPEPLALVGATVGVRVVETVAVPPGVVPMVAVVPDCAVPPGTDVPGWAVPAGAGVPAAPGIPTCTVWLACPTTPRASRASAVSVCSPGDRLLLSHSISNGG